MQTLRWLFGLARRRSWELVGTALSIALAVAFVVSLGAFVTSSRAGLAARAAVRVPVDWQVQVTPQGRAAEVMAAVEKLPGLRAASAVRLAKVPGLESTGRTGTRATGQAFVVALPPDYARVFPAEIRFLLGARAGTLLLQQTAANLAAAPGDVITVRRASGNMNRLRVDGVADMPAADSFFQIVGAPPGAGAAAPPDNVVLVPPARFADLTRGSTVIEQIHVGFDHSGLPSDPAAAASAVDRRANHLQVAVAGGALVGDNLGTSLSVAVEDARYASLLFLLVGVPGLALAALVAALVVALRGDRRRREIALLQLRGATPAALLRIVGGETLATAILGCLVGLALAVLAVRLALPAGTPLSTGWIAGGLATGVGLAAATQLAPIARAAGRRGSEQVAAGMSRALRNSPPWPLRFGLDVVCLGVAAAAFYLTARSKYQVVLAPEGVTSTQVNYAALLGPALAWPALALLVWRVTAAVLKQRRGRSLELIGRRTKDRGGRAPELTAAAIRRRRWVIARGATGLAVALGLAASTAIFTATYRAQSNLDVALTVGSDVAVVEPPGAQIPPDRAAQLAGVADVSAVEPLVHRFAYVGPDLQDLYGIRPDRIASVAPLRDSFVPGSTIKDALTQLDRTPDGVLLSAETLYDYQLHPGDTIRLRLQAGPGGRYKPVGFHVLGQIAEFPTAPKDSFIVANAAYIAKVTGSDRVGTFLVSSTDPPRTAAALRRQVAGSGARVQDVDSARAEVTTASGLAATDLTGLSRLELGFGVLLSLACSSLALALGIAERRRALVLLAALGASARQRGQFLTAEARALLTGGLVGGAIIGAVIAYLLVKVLTGIFDPPPTGPALPWAYLVGLGSVVVAATIGVVATFGRLAGRAGPAELRDL